MVYILIPTIFLYPIMSAALMHSDSCRSQIHVIEVQVLGGEVFCAQQCVKVGCGRLGSNTEPFGWKPNSLATTRLSCSVFSSFYYVHKQHAIHQKELQQHALHQHALHQHEFQQHALQ